ncbi:helicase-exonuclease AddAB subunit AddA [Enterocloster clostridioformis]|uniref:helicase-exonuclease AddAB subunit AddA n=1 Tax=Enterocloster clostridioformis TaxID=1531 RepID=UPI00080C517D|nr:helicase-exonuclease AddAB subunit AddA [Enterocloster clostridioformis]ANU48937.1 helicase-exonuclease AddAB subunit AddA [Lachnoclostridium sp. YL32]NDO32174.1 helicase-exonuclease AddAB subunit AddA [Enterocloster clostridioformis]OXE64078.1 helicase-exonuclease AddAB subunit AddA [Enterocloster clostridioformis]QQR02149.1 helicase-exonuclease AddAB subunit AddA [Enterocloster clostridioformis]
MAVNWTSKQQEVIDSRNRNLLVSAAAGSGKTAVLVERIIQMISEGDRPLDIDQLLVMTFTNAAAAEMRERIGAAVEQKLKERPEDEHLWLQAALIPQAQITTIDSFCLNIIRSHYNSLDIDPAFRMGDEGELSLLRGDCMGEMLENCYDEADAEFARFVEHFGRGKSDRGIEDVILQAWQFSQSHPWPGEWLASCQKELEEESILEMEESPWMVFLMEDVARQMEELSGQLGEALQVCLEENGPLAYEPMLISDRSKIEAIGRAAATGNFEALYNSLQNMSFGRLASIRSKDIDGDKKAFVSACRDRVKKAVAKCRELYGQQSPEEVVESMRGTRTVIRELLRLTGMFDQAYRDAKRERNVLDFNDLEHLALEVLYEREETGDGEETVSRRPSQVADELSRQYEEILVDEYQDSNYVQEALITGISRERSGHPNVFMVGDVKQSIYRFRLARPELFMDKYETYSRERGPRQMIELQQNFRSRESVLTSVNDVFYQIMTKNLGGITYTPETALYPGAKFEEVSGKTVLDPEADAGKSGSREAAPVSLKAGTPTELLLVDTGADTLRQLDEDSLDYTAKELEARLIAGRIRQLVSEDQGILVWDKSRGGYRRARYGDMVILLRSMSGWSEVFVNVLMNEGIPAFAQTRTGYFNTVEVETILSLLSVVDNPMQDIPLAAVMRSPIVGMDDEEMAWMMAVYKRNSKKGQDRGVYGAWKLWLEEGWITVGLSGIPVKTAHSISFKSRRLSVLMERLRGEARHLPIHELLYRVYRESGYYDYVSAMPAGETRRANLDMLVEKAAAYESTSYKGLFHFVRYIEKLKKFDTDFGEASVAGEQDNTVRIMSIHKSKGLEFPVVFLAGLGKRFNKQDAYGQILLDADLGAAADFLDLELRVKAPTLKKQALKRRTELETMGEELRVLYVAMTRAKEKLIMTAADKSLENKLGKWKDIPLSQGQLPYTILASANSCLDWLLMAQPAIPASHMEMRQIQVKDLIGEEITRQIIRKMKKEDLLNLDGKRVYDAAFGTRLREVLEYEYPYESDIGLYAMVSVSELKKQSQIGRTEDAIGTDSGNLEGIALGELKALTGSRDMTGSGPGESGEQKKTVSAGPNRAALRGTAYHAVLEHIHFHEIHGLAEVKPVVYKLLEGGFLDQEAHDFINPKVIWNFLSSPLGKRMAKAQSEGRIHKEQQFIIGIPAREMGLGDSDELVLIQGIIDAYLEEEDGLVLIDYKTDHVPEGDPKQGAKMLAERYRVQLDYYERALTQLTGKHVKERIIYSLALQMSINV